MMNLNKSHKIAHLLLTLLVAIVFCLPFHSVASAQGSDGVNDKPKFWARWKMEVDFTSGATVANWTVVFGRFDYNVTPPALTVEMQKTEPITCTPLGTFHISNQQAVLDGAGYLTCATPSFYETVQTMAEKVAAPGEESDVAFMLQRLAEFCTCVGPVPWVATDLTVDISRTSNPLIHEVNGALQFYTPLQGVLAGNYALHSNMLLNGTPVSEPYTWSHNPSGNQLWSGYGVDSFLAMTDPNGWANFLPTAFYPIAKSVRSDQFLHWADSTAPTTFPFAQPFSITSKATVFNIGFDGSQYFVGKIRKLGWDPGCTAH